MIQNFDALRFRQVSEDALIPAAEFIKKRITGEEEIGEYLIKGDKTLVTDTDRKSEEISRPIILSGFSDWSLKQEETKGVLGNPNSDIKLYHDPLDGTGGFLMGGATPTIILAAYDSLSKEVLACSTMEPSTGRFWFSSKGNGAFLKRYDYYMGKFDSQEGKQVRVNNKEGLNGSHVLVDVDHGFERTTLKGEKRKVLFPEGRREISRLIELYEGKVASFYTNGGHYAYVATGRPTLIGCITTAIGGPFDIAGIRHVLEAGGEAQCYRIDRIGYGRELYALEPTQDIESADLVIAANNKGNLEKLEEILKNATSIN